MYFPVGAVCQDVQGRTCPPVFSFLKLWPAPPPPRGTVLSTKTLSICRARETCCAHNMIHGPS